MKTPTERTSVLGSFGDCRTFFKSKLAILGLLLLTEITAVAQGVILSTGQNYAFEFTSLTYSRPAQPTDNSSFDALFAPGTFSNGESVLIEIFPNALSDVSLSNLYTHVGPADPLGSLSIGFGWLSSSAPFWPDLQGFTRVTMLNGDAQLDAFRVWQVVDGNVYSGVFHVPEPSTFSLGICAYALSKIFLPPQRLRQTRRSSKHGMASWFAIFASRQPSR